VFGSLSPFGREGALADTIVVPDDRVPPIPQNLDAAQALVCRSRVARYGKRSPTVARPPGPAGAHHRCGRRRGHFAVQIQSFRASSRCAARETPRSRATGADQVVDYAREDFTRRNDRFDVISTPRAHRLAARARCSTGQASTSTPAATRPR
jgi:hypothetical protein